ncbi:hypothetical protein AVEN_146614-1 [Araneus ventricosus]|uniref:Uncharacterized protein n=1 Tax=Araneus ventricosus TaxID=182803 RepID=A0A4Y2F2V7_ARAVE|nr:hypothetical protein AVEN_146614-1 [Araneus ventricosus]
MARFACAHPALAIKSLRTSFRRCNFSCKFLVDIECLFASSVASVFLNGGSNYHSGKLRIIEAGQKLLPKSISICSWSLNSYIHWAIPTSGYFRFLGAVKQPT